MNLIKSTKIKIFIVLFVIVFVEAVVLLTITKNIGMLGGDSQSYNNLAQDLKTFSSHNYGSYEPTIFRTVGYPLFLSILYKIAGDSVLTIRVAQFFLLLFSSYLLYFLATRFAKEDSAFYSSIFCITYLPFVFFCLAHLTEVLSIFLIITSIVLVVKIEESKSYKLSLLLGLVLGYLSLVRPSFFLLAGLILLAVLVSNKIVFNKKIIISISIVIGLILCISPWTIRNKIVTGEFLLLATGKGVSLYVSAEQYKGEITYTMSPSDWDKIIEEDFKRYSNSKEVVNTLNLQKENTTLDIPLNPKIEFLQDKIYTDDALNKFRSVSPEKFLLNYPIRIAYLFSTADFPPPHIYNSTHLLAQLQYIVFIFLALIGIYTQRHSLLKQYLLWIVPIYIVLTHSVFHVEARYSLPARPFLLIYAAIGFSFLIRRLWVTKTLLIDRYQAVKP